MAWLLSWRVAYKAFSIGLFTVLSLINFFMLRDVLSNAPTWYQDYGLGGMQYGAQQLFPKIADRLKEDPQIKIYLSPNWANGTDIVARFFLNDPLPVEMGSVDGHIVQHRPLDQNTLFVMTPEEYLQTIDSGKFKQVSVEDTISYPNGRPGFYFVRLAYVDDIESIIDAERQQRSVLRSARILLDGDPVQVKHSLLDMGEAHSMFDGDQHSLGRSFEANPAVIELAFDTLRSISGVSVIIGSTEVEIRALLYPPSKTTPIEHLKTFHGTIEQPEAVFNFGEPTRVETLRLEVRDLRQEEPGNVHIWEIKLLD
jgi:hypothetical protein